MFNKERYINFIETKQGIAEITIIAILILFITTGIILNLIFIKKNMLLTVIPLAIIGFIIGYSNYKKTIIKLEEMKMKLDIYEKVMDKENINV